MRRSSREPEPRVYFLSYSANVPSRELPPEHLERRGYEVPDAETAMEVSPGVYVAASSYGRTLLPDGSIGQGLTVTVWGKKVPA